MSIGNTNTHYGWLSIALHWLTALTVVGLFSLGLWMMSIDYYHPWYHTAPDLHKSIGVTLILVVLFRLGWRLAQPRPAPLSEHKPWERKAAHITPRPAISTAFANVSKWLFD